MIEGKEGFVAILGNDTIREVTGIEPEKITAIQNFLQGAVYCWCKNRKDEWFSLRDLMGGDNFYWNATPLIAAYQKHEGVENIDPIQLAGRDVGWILKKVIIKDKRIFQSEKIELIRKYRWIPG